MHIVIMGCGRVGSTIAHILEDQGHSVAIIDQDPDSFRRLHGHFKGQRVTGIGPQAVLFVAFGFAVADDVEPVLGPALAVAGRSQ